MELFFQSPLFRSASGDDGGGDDDDDDNDDHSDDGDDDDGDGIAVFSASHARAAFTLTRYTSNFILPVIKNDPG